MKNFEMLDKMGGIDPGYVAEAQKKASPFKLAARIALPAAACLCLALGAFAVIKAAAKQPAEPREASGAQNTSAVAVIAQENAGATAANTEPEGAEQSGFDPYLWPDDTDSGEKQIRTFVTYYEPVGSSEHPLIPAGDHALSPTLRTAIGEYGALDQYGNEVIYVVTVEIYEDVCQLMPSIADELAPAVEAEAKRLFEEAGITTDISKYFDGENTHWQLNLHATAEQLQNFPANPRYGYWIMLRSETFDEYGEPVSSVVFGGNDQN